MKQCHHAGLSDRTHGSSLDQLTRLLRLRGTFLAVFAVYFAAGLAATHAAPPSLQPLVHAGKWPTMPGGTALDVKVEDNYAYVALGAAGLVVIDVSNPANPVRVGGYTNGGFTRSVAASGNYAFVTDAVGLQVLDVSYPANPQRVGGVANPYIGTVVVSGNRAYVTYPFAGLVIYDVSNPAAPVRLGGYRPSSDGDSVTDGVAVSGNYAYLWVEDIGLLVIDVSQPTNCVRLGRYRASGDVNGVTVSGNYAFVGDNGGLQVVDVSNPANPVRVGGYAAGGFVGDVALWGNHAYVTVATGLQVIDVRNPTNCVRVGGDNTSRYAYGVTVVAGRIYLAAGTAGLVVLPTLPNVQFTVRVDASPGAPFTLEAATNLTPPITWMPLLTTNVSTMPFDYVDFDVKLSDKPQKFYSVRQP